MPSIPPASQFLVCLPRPLLSHPPLSLSRSRSRSLSHARSLALAPSPFLTHEQVNEAKQVLTGQNQHQNPFR